jgi:hypothetical protein
MPPSRCCLPCTALFSCVLVPPLICHHCPNLAPSRILLICHKIDIPPPIDGSASPHSGPAHKPPPLPSLLHPRPPSISLLARPAHPQPRACFSLRITRAMARVIGGRALGTKARRAHGELMGEENENNRLVGGQLRLFAKLEHS